MTTIAYIGNFSRPWHTEEHVARDAEAIGCTVHRIEERDIISDRDVRDFLPIGINTADLVLYTKTIGLPARALQVWRGLEEAGVKTASYHLDLYRGLSRGVEVLSDPFWQTGTVFTADGDPDTRDELALLGIDHRWLPAGIVSDEAIEVEDVEPIYENVAEIVFVGSWRGYHPEWPWRLELLRALRERYGQAFAMYGSHGGEVRGLDLNRLYQAPGRIVVGDSLALPGHQRYWSDRYYETIGRGGFLIAPRVPGLTDHFQDGGHFVGYDIGDLEQLFALIDFYRDHPDIARLIAKDGQAHCRRYHTYKHRVAQMLIMLGIKPPVPLEQIL